MEAVPFEIAIPDADVADLRERLRRTRWPDEVEGAGWDYGTNLGFMREWAAYWAEGFDWRKQEAWLNRFSQFKSNGIHFVHLRSPRADATPLLMLHGWPSTFVQMLQLAPMLLPDFHVVAASLPGYGFSDRPTQKGMNVGAMAEPIHRVMTDALGYSRYGIRASDLGAGTATVLGGMHPEAVVGLHLSGSSPFVFWTPDDLTDAERRFIQDAEAFRQAEGAYAMEHATKPQTLAYGLNDSPAGLAGWILEKFRAWSDCGGDLESVYSRDELLTNVSIYWFTGTINASIRAYYESFRAAAGGGSWGKSPVPVGLAMPEHDLIRAPREWEERSANVVRWTDLPRGGHFVEWEQPDLVADDLRAFFANL